MMQNTWGYMAYQNVVQSKTVNPQWYTYIIQSRNVLGFSKAVKRVGQNLIVNAGNMTIADEEFYRVVPLGGNFYVVDTKTDKIYVGSANDIEPGDFILTRNLIDLPWDTVIYK